jgi:E3 ubiquitin-protein ligase TRIP12
VRISRDNLFESAIKVLHLYGTSDSILEIEYHDEVGTGLGPTLEFYADTSKAFCRKSLGLWRDTTPDDASEFVFSPQGLFPRPMHPDYLDSRASRQVKARMQIE